MVHPDPVPSPDALRTARNRIVAIAVAVAVTTAHLGHLALPALVLPPDDEDLVVLADRHRAGGVLGPEVLAQRRGHDLPLEARGGGEVRLARLAAVRCEAWGRCQRNEAAQWTGTLRAGEPAC